MEDGKCNIMDDDAKGKRVIPNSSARTNLS